MKKEETLQYIKKYIADYGYPPSYREICAGVGIRSTSTVSLILDKLEEEGYICRVKSRNRTIKILRE